MPYMDSAGLGMIVSIERSQGKAPGTVIFRLSGPFTARDMHGSLSPVTLRNAVRIGTGERGRRGDMSDVRTKVYGCLQQA